MPYARQLQRKQQFVADLFEDVAGEDCILEPILGMDNPFRFRNKIVSPFAPGRRLAKGGARQKDGNRARRSDARGNKSASNDGSPAREVLCGMYAYGTHRIVPVENCPVEHECGRRIVRAVSQIMRKYGVSAYNEDVGTGFMRHVVVRVGHESSEVLVTLVTNAQQFPGAKNFARELVKRCPEITTVVQNVNMRQTNAIFGNEEHVIYGPGFILDTLCGLSFRISSHSFYQVNAVQTEVLYCAAVRWALQQEDEDDVCGKQRESLSIMDAYCGTGTIGLVAASMAGNARVVGVDKVESAIRDARQNAAHNGIENATFVTADAGPYLRECAAKGQRFDVLLMDPPRAGATEEFLRAAAESGIGRIVYISCNPHTQVRDVRYLQQFGYAAKRIQPVDMFPHTDHVECVVLLSRGTRNQDLQEGDNH
ncbi:MAG: 23S rRNA (uracil(1939)-C(5))-methyltransferase RlmD [Eggerthellaceae bacterium]|nr:23S rRNA (uracil(1939)-C(5))-methyltransferase RlmD [Eggerthellaceae bacterium]